MGFDAKSTVLDICVLSQRTGEVRLGDEEDPGGGSYRKTSKKGRFKDK